MRPPRLAVITTAALLASACATDEGTTGQPSFEAACAVVAGCQTPRNAAAGPREAIWRVLVRREADGKVSIAALAEVDVASAIGRPEGPLMGTHGLAALDANGKALEFQRLSFPRTLILEGVDPFEQRQEVDLSSQPSSTVGYLRASADVAKLAVVDAAGKIVFERAAPAPGEAKGSSGTGSKSSPLVQIAPTSACAHVMLIESPADAIWYSPALQAGNPLEPEVTPTQRAVVQAALGMMTPMHCAGISRIAFAELRDSSGNIKTGVGGVVVASYGDLLLINAEAALGDPANGGERLFTETALQGAGRRAYLMYTLFHEAAHNAEWLLNNQAGLTTDYGGVWEPSKRSQAQDTIDRVRLRGGFGPAWTQLHSSFVRAGLAQPYLTFPIEELQKSQIRKLDPAGLAKWGYISYYATATHSEDIAETVAYALAAPLRRAAGSPQGPPPDVNDYGCVAMRAYQGQGIPQGLSLVFAKLAFVRDLRLIEQRDFEACAGTSIGFPPLKEGFSVYENGTLKSEYTQDVKGQIGTLGNHYVFEMTATGRASFGGKMYPTTLRLQLNLGKTTVDGKPRPLDHVSWPRGVYSITPLHEHNKFLTRLDGAPAGNVNVTEGSVLVTESSNDRLVGSVVVTKGWRPDAPVPLPQTFDPPLQFRFKLQ